MSSKALLISFTGRRPIKINIKIKLRKSALIPITPVTNKIGLLITILNIQLDA
jgi:hypothetical protein